MTGLTVYEKAPDPTQMMIAMGKSIHASRMFGCENEAQGQVLALACMVKGRDPLSLIEQYHIIKGKLSMRADAMLAGLHALGGSHQIIQRDADGAAIEITYKGKTRQFSFTWEEALKEPLPYQGKDSDIVPVLLAGKADKLTLKPKYATPRSRSQMLWARVVSDGVRAVAPEVCAGKYTPEEVDDFNGQDGQDAAQVVNEAPLHDPPAAAPAGPPEEVDADPMATPAQIAEITTFFQELGVPADAQLAAFQKRGAESIASLTEQSAAELIEALRAKHDAAKSPQDARQVSMANTEPCTEQQNQRIRDLIKQIAQKEGGHGITDRIKEKLQATGVGRIAALTVSEAELLENSLATENLKLFFDADLKGHGLPTKEADQGNA